MVFKKKKEGNKQDELFEDRIKQFDEHRWKNITLMNCLTKAKPSIYSLIIYEKKEESKKEVMVYLYDDKQEYEKHKEQVRSKNHKGVELLDDNNGNPLYLYDMLSINIIPEVQLNDNKRISL